MSSWSPVAGMWSHVKKSDSRSRQPWAETDPIFLKENSVILHPPLQHLLFVQLMLFTLATENLRPKILQQFQVCIHFKKLDWESWNRTAELGGCFYSFSYIRVPKILLNNLSFICLHLSQLWLKTSPTCLPVISAFSENEMLIGSNITFYCMRMAFYYYLLEC